MFTRNIMWEDKNELTNFILNHPNIKMSEKMQVYSQHAGIKLRSVFGDNPGGGTTQLKNCPRRNCLQTVKGET